MQGRPEKRRFRAVRRGCDMMLFFCQPFVNFRTVEAQGFSAVMVRDAVVGTPGVNGTYGCVSGKVRNSFSHVHP